MGFWDSIKDKNLGDAFKDLKDSYGNAWEQMQKEFSEKEQTLKEHYIKIESAVKDSDELKHKLQNLTDTYEEKLKQFQSKDQISKDELIGLLDEQKVNQQKLFNEYKLEVDRKEQQQSKVVQAILKQLDENSQALLEQDKQLASLRRISIFSLLLAISLALALIFEIYT
ncbi:hypothetical protein V6R21_18050 [Limibacter armeniacum]|uniref:hypothetical protein n=1 Tax=Limibacter armeniacum TaxID=466084 RepID=UPI002FE62580